MGDTTKIGWLNPPGLAPGHTWNPWQGCTKISAGCQYCYMFEAKHRFGQNPSVVVRSKDPTFYAPLRWKDPSLVFACSWSDFMHPSADAWRAEAWKIIRQTQHLTYLILTKRTAQIAECLPADWYGGYPNVWLGYSVEDTAALHRRMSEIAAANGGRGIHATKWFISYEPALGPLVLPFRCADWVIAGGESGPHMGAIAGGETNELHPRAPHPDWIRSIRDQCMVGASTFLNDEERLRDKLRKVEALFARASMPGERMAAGEAIARIKARLHDAIDFKISLTGPWFGRPIPFFFKQWGGIRHDAGGRLLDGREWNEWPPIRGQRLDPQISQITQIPEMVE